MLTKLAAIEMNSYIIYCYLYIVRLSFITCFVTKAMSITFIDSKCHASKLKSYICTYVTRFAKTVLMGTPTKIHILPMFEYTYLIKVYT